MLQDALLAWFHYLAIFVLVVIMTAEAVLLRPGLAPDTVRRPALYDRFFGVSAVAVLVTGVLRLMPAPRARRSTWPIPGSTPRSRSSS